MDYSLVSRFVPEAAPVIFRSSQRPHRNASVAC